MKFTNRKQEMARLDSLMRRRRPGVAVLWGRRRVGKTRLLLEWTQKHKGIYYTADESAASIQRKYFATAIGQALPGFAEVEYPDWMTLLLRLAQDAAQANWKGPIVIDELPYLIATAPELPSVLQRFIDREAKKAKLVLALCGSAQHMMQGAILDSSAPLYGRADELIKLGPISVGYMSEALKIKKPRDLIETYAIWGGIPRYWELVEKNGGSLFENIDKLVLDPMGPLSEEPSRLLLEESPPAINLRPILDAIGLGSHRLSEVAGRIGQPSTALTRPIQRLIELDLVQREIPYGTDAANSKKALYKIKDPFVRFWFEVVAPKRSFLSQASPAARAKWLKDTLPHLFAIAWEEMCRQAIPLLGRTLGSEAFGPAGRFWSPQEGEWDALSQSHDGKTLLVGEVKWTAKMPSAAWVLKTIEELKNKGIPPVPRRPDAALMHVLFVPEKPKQLSLPPGVKIVDAKEVIRALR